MNDHDEHWAVSVNIASKVLEVLDLLEVHIVAFARRFRGANTLLGLRCLKERGTA